jgi:deoxyribonuclease V
VLAQAAPVDVLVIDGYMDLDPSGRPGLGAHVHAEVGLPVIGVAKTAFRAASHAVAVHRGAAIRPLFVTAVGVPLDVAVDLVAGMSGRYRIPDALRRVDALARRGLP